MPKLERIKTPLSFSSSPSQIPLQGSPVQELPLATLVDSSLVHSNDSAIQEFSLATTVEPSLVQSDDSGASFPIFNGPKDTDYYLDTAIFKVEGTLYKVAKYHFLKSQDFFVAKFAECKSEDEVISLDDVYKDDFRIFLKLLYPLSIMSTQTFATEEWIAVLRLSTQWKMFDIRNLAIRQLSLAKINPIDKIVLAQKYSIPQWLSCALLSLICREDSLSMDEADKLGFKLALKICRVRDASRILPDVRDDDTWSSAISIEFQEELQLPVLSAVERVIRARKCGVFEFLRASYSDLVERPEPLSDDEAVILGCESTARICRVREQLIAGDLSAMSNRGIVDNELRAELSTTSRLSAIQRVVMSRGNVAEWLQRSLVEAAQRRQFSSDEVEILGKGVVIGLYRVREAMYSTQWGAKSRGVCQTMIDMEFSDEIRGVRDGAKRYSGTEEASVEQTEYPEGPTCEATVGWRTDDADEPAVANMPMPSGHAGQPAPQPQLRKKRQGMPRG